MGDRPGSIMAAMSGGVDSSVAAALLLEQGCDVAGATMLLPTYGRAGADDLAARRAEGAQRVAGVLGIPFHVVDLRREFEERIVQDFCDAYRAGRTPNPCVRCNEQVKFGLLLGFARAQGAGALATGHYVRTAEDPESGRRLLVRAAGADDQSYFLHRLSQEQLRQAVFPLGECEKPQVRAMARKLGLAVHDKPKSQDLCFLPDGQYRDLLRARCPEAFRPGPILDVQGRKVGEHAGIAAYTVGQRRGLGVAGGRPLYVLAVRPGENAVVVGPREGLMRRTMLVGDVNWIAEPPKGAVRAQVRIRYNDPGGEAVLTPVSRGDVRVEFIRAPMAPCPGQSAVFYNRDTVLGGGEIESTQGDADADV